ncbi:MAG TPA: hypothetical protein VGI39_07000 [Polyangiaceae bacterium]
MTTGYSAPAFGVLPTGFQKKLPSDVFLDMQTAARANVDANLDLSPTEPMGQMTQIMANSIAECWEILEVLAGATDPNNAEGFILVGISALTGTQPSQATFGKVVCTVNMNSSTTLAAGTLANVAGQPSNTWQLVGPADGSGNLVTTGDLVSTTAGNYSAVFQCTQSGPVAANAGTLTSFPVLPTGINSITNPADAIQGTVADTDATLRAKRQAELAVSDGGTLDGIRAAVLKVAGVEQAFVFENKTGVTDGFGRPPHSVEVVIWDGIIPAASNAQIAQAMWQAKEGGIPFYSATGDSGTAVDSLGSNQTVVFSRAVVTNIYVTATATPTATAITAPAIKRAYADWALSNIGLGSTLYARAFSSAPLDGPYAVTGLEDIVTFQFGTAPSPSNTANIAGSTRVLYYVDTSRITVDGF